PTVKTLDVSITIDDITSDNVINEEEATKDIPVTGKVGGDAKEGDTVTLTVNGNTYTGTVKADLTYSIDVPGSDLASSNNKVDATITITDTAGNSVEATAYKTPGIAPTITINGSTVTEANTGEVTGNKVLGEVTISFDKPLTEKLTVTLSNNQKVEFEAGNTSKTVNVKTSRIDDAYKQGTTNETISIKSTSNSEIFIENKTATITIQDDIDPVNMTITATVTTPKIIDVNTKTDGTTGVKVTGYNSDGIETKLSVIKGTNHDGFGVAGKNLSNGDTRELGLGEKIVVEFTDGKDVNSLDVSFAWRNNNETAKLTFIKDDKVIGYATVDGDGKSTTKAIVKYYDINNNIIKEVNAKGSSDKVDEAFTFELPDSNGGLVSFDKVEFSAPKSKDDYLIHEIKYKEVLNTEVTDIVTNGGNVTFNIQIDEKYPPQGKATASVEINGKTYNVELNATGRGTLTIDSSKLGDLSKVEAKVIKIEGGNYEKVNTENSETKFDFTSTHNNLTSSDDNISTDEDVSYTLKVTDFGDVSPSTKEFKITELPQNGKLYVVITKGETIFNKDGSQTVATEDSKVEVSKGQVISLAQVGAGQVVFEPTPNSDVDGQFKFQVGDGKGNFSSEYTTTIDVKAVADAPTVSIDITKVGETTIVIDENSSSIPTGNVINSANTYWTDNEVLQGTGAGDIINIGTGSNKIINAGAGDDIINTPIQSGNNLGVNHKIDGGVGNDTLVISEDKLGELNGNKYEYKITSNDDGTTTIEKIGFNNYGSWSLNHYKVNIQNVEKIQFTDGTYIINSDGTLGDKINSEIAEYKYDITVNAKLTDNDGSESLSKDENGNEIITLKNIPNGSTLYNGEAKLSLTNENEVSDTDLNSIKASATSNEVNEKDEVTDSATSTVDNILSSDISLDNLQDIINENGEINLANSKSESLSLTLDDVIKLSGDDNVIKISGDNFDSVTFKDTVGENGQENNWSKVAGTDTDQGYDIYTNSGDPTIQVKVEQPISDGITS
ncbi:Ig-like domain-containing protein, partial [Aliarcobacter cryaerophilus]|uniref:Ig-like domain-containing protein n=1 Tax=Aliarcobacter cryaerophilus TaxID=28198 RepID=UPI0021B4A0CA